MAVNTLEMPVELKYAFLVYAQLPIHKRRLDRARQRVSEWLALCRNPRIAFSGGKDSHCTLTLIREQKPDCLAVYIDADCAFPEVETLLNATPNLIKYPADEPFLDTLARVGLDNPSIEAITMRTTVYGPIKRLQEEYGFDGSAYGLRAEESKGRRMHGVVRGAVFQYKRDGLWGCQPIWDWTYEDVWGFMVSNNIPYCGTYDRMWHMPQREQRISYWAGESSRNFGRYAWLKINYPELYFKLCEKVPEVSFYA